MNPLKPESVKTWNKNNNASLSTTKEKVGLRKYKINS